ncbi:MAG: hypothetical protein QOI84_802 [Solirubrobacterales bacterium]|jgi:hypothetical protein|nr:hypothetical protein [Solirubrobacterales bacterium]
MAWTDERLEERFDGIDRRFDEVGRHFDDTSRQLDHRFGEVDRRLDQANRETNHRLDSLDEHVGELRQAMLSLHTTLARGSFGVILALIGAIGALVATGG